jgi:hypothetical protein
MPTYRCYFLDKRDHIKAAADLEADALAAVIDKALVLLKKRPEHHSIEIWQGAQRLYPSRGEEPPTPA